jgi:CheY-like chemotaxis protein
VIGRHILLVEDDTGIRESVAECLESEGYRVTSASNGVEGLQSLRASVPDLIVLDLVMPLMNGTQFLATVRQDPGFKDIPVVLMTAAMPSTSMPIPQADGYLAKPFELTDLLDAVDRYARRAA